MADTAKNPPGGAQRHSLDRLARFERLGYGMFIHFGMSTFDLDELSKGDKPSTHYAPDRLDVDQWVSVARDAGMGYAVLTTKHVAGHCLWPTRLNDYHVGTSGNKTNVVEQFVRSCEKRGVRPGFYYCCWDNRNRFGSMPPTFAAWDRAYTTQEYRDFQTAQMEELLTQFGGLETVWVDIPGILGADGRRKQYEQIARLQPDALVTMNHGFGDGSSLKYSSVWPTDVMTIERWLPSSNRGYNPWFSISPGKTTVTVAPNKTEAKDDPAMDYYIPGEVCDPIGYDWFYHPRDVLRPDSELLGMRLLCQARKANLLLDIGPDQHGLIPAETVKSLMRLRRNFESASRFERE